MSFVFSPSNMMNYRNCPRRFMGQSITKEIKWKASKEKSRGSLVHTDVQKALKDGIQAVTTWQDGMNMMYVMDKVQEVRRKVAAGAPLFIEQEMCVNHKFQPVGWWDEDGLLRAKADTLVLSQPALIIDVKSGRKYDTDDFQLRISALLVHLVYKVEIVDYEYWYVDSGETVDGSIDFRNGLTPVQDTINLMKEMTQALKDNNFPPRKHQFCKWCDFHKTVKCGL